MILFRIPSHPWEVVATDLFMLDNSDYSTCIWSLQTNVPDVPATKLQDTKSPTVITHTKSIFARHGIPSEVISDNGPQYSSKELKQFANQWEFTHIMVSPMNPQTNVLVEKAVQTVKDQLT